MLNTIILLNDHNKALRLTVPECYQHSGGGSRMIRSITARFGADKTADSLVCRIGTIVPVIILQVGILVP